MIQKITTFLMFEGTCEQAMNFYVSLFADAAVANIRRYGKEGPGVEGSVMQAAFTVAGQTFASTVR
jgi:predicted 3-demethylubiquinone-9 3-methyltransferase (glyoxalase superfamily)